ncbi:hypothetical protein KUTeg_002222 [Tegillarca granosa]|uniref:PARP14 second type I KH domain-containing protein n=1 Tax=Tegillarca granosa TaxID=220873 RepID=A0ABQ9FWI0_TEGGR|nr:hypothetical protein KUTeg_002222 [Tegillarca granosa]
MSMLQLNGQQQTDDPLKITCTLSTDVKDYKKLAKSWKKSTLEILDQFLNAINIEKIDILQEAWDLVLDGLKSLNVTHPDGVTISIDKTATEIFVVGYKNIIDEVSKQVKQIVNKVTEELDRKKKQVVETINIDKPYQLGFYDSSNSKTKWLTNSRVSK